MSSYSVFCECGVTHPVSATQAGSTMTCGCGRSVDVPTLSSLRKSAGESAIPSDTIETIQAMIRGGELPSGDICPYSGRPANDTIFFHVQCERVWVRGGESLESGNFAYMFLGWIGALIALQKLRPREELGRDISLEVPLCISSDVRPTIMGMRRQRGLKALLCQTHIYAQLLQEFPRATVTVIKTS